jgi:hypothetical protein
MAGLGDSLEKYISVVSASGPNNNLATPWLCQINCRELEPQVRFNTLKALLTFIHWLVVSKQIVELQDCQ